MANFHTEISLFVLNTLLITYNVHQNGTFKHNERVNITGDKNKDSIEIEWVKRLLQCILRLPVNVVPITLIEVRVKH